MYIAEEFFNNKGQYGEFTFKTIDIVKMMSIAQSRLARRSGLSEEGMPDYLSPPISPENSNLKELNQNDIVHNYFYTPDQCSICLCMISENRKKLQCNHSFHKSCITTWLAKMLGVLYVELFILNLYKI